jgi:hypothetical protein
VLVLPLGTARCPEIEAVAAALGAVGLLGRVVSDSSQWQQLEAVVVVPWAHQ